MSHQKAGGVSGSRALDRKTALKDLIQIPGVGNSIATDLIHIGINTVGDLKGKDPEMLYKRSNAFADTIQDRCLLYVFRCAVYYADTTAENRDPDLLKWWTGKTKSEVVRPRNATPDGTLCIVI